MSDYNINLYHAWRQAEADLISIGIAYGSRIEDEWLRKAFGLPGLDAEKTIAEHERNELIFLRQFSLLRAALLKTHNMMLRPVKGGYVVVMPQDQTRVAMRDRVREVRSALEKLGRELNHIEVDLLSDDQLRENSDAVAKLGAMRLMMRRKQLAA